MVLVLDLVLEEAHPVLRRVLVQQLAPEREPASEVEAVQVRELEVGS
jgi:hypothetical protein